MKATNNGCDNDTNSHNGDNTDLWTRRETLSRTAASVVAASAFVGSSSPEAALAADAANVAATKQEIFAKLAAIPTFCLVNGAGAGTDFAGVPFDIYDPSAATATGYFFMNYETAVNSLKVASDLDAEKGDGNIWATAAVKVIPLSVAVQMSLSRRRRVAINTEQGVNGIQVDTVHSIIPSEDGNSDAQRLDTSRNQNAKKWETKGRVPIFYVPEPGAAKKKYYYWDRKLLVADYARRFGGETIPEIQLVELIDVFRKAQASNDWESLRDFVDTIQPSPEARVDAIRILKEDAANPKNAVTYNFDKVFLVVAAKK